MTERDPRGRESGQQGSDAGRQAQPQQSSDQRGQNQQGGMDRQSGQQSAPRAGQPSGQAQQFDQGAPQQWGNAGTDHALAGQIREHMEVCDANGETIGRVDSVEGDRIKLTRQDSPDGEHHYISISELAGIENGQLRLAAGRGDEGSRFE